MDVGLVIVNALLAVLDILPAMPDIVLSAVDDFMDLVIDNAYLTSFFFPVSFALPILTIVAFMANWKRIYFFLMWVWRKIPISSD